MLIDEYINYTNKYKSIYSKSIVFIQIGSFFEIYGLEKEGADVDEICKILDITSTRKNTSKSEISRSNPKMAGIPLFTSDKYIEILNNNGYVVIMVEQVTPPPQPKREVTRIISPATKEVNSSPENNYLLSLYFTVGSIKNNKFITGSIAYIDINTNDSYVFETTEYDTLLNLEDINKTILTIRPSEMVIFTDTSLQSNKDFLNIIDDFVIKLPIFCIHNKINDLINENFFKLSYQSEVLKKVFKNTGMLSVIEYLNFEKHPLLIVCYTYLLQFIYEYNEKLFSCISKPIILDNDKYLCLVNNAIENLNIISTVNNSKTGSILNYLNNCKTNIGKRYFKNCILNPITSLEIIQHRYDMCEYFIKNDLYSEYRSVLNDISDLERLFKRIISKTIISTSFVSIHDSVIKIEAICKKLDENTFNFDNINWTNTDRRLLNDFISHIQTTYDLEKIESFFKHGIHLELDKLKDDINIFENIFENVCFCLNEGSDTGEFKLEITKGKQKDKITRTISITKNRYETMLKDSGRVHKINRLLKEKCSLTLDDINTKPYSVSNKTQLKVYFTDMDSTQIKLMDMQSEFKSKLQFYYEKELQYIQDTYKTLFESMIQFVSQLDFYCCNAYNSLKNCYIKPELIEDEDSYIISEKLRHPLIEVIQTDVPYISNNIEIGTSENKGILLYGLNSAGKSSLMKSVGVNLILAQSGMYVAAKSFIYSPYKKVFTRIPCGDNILKGQSTFVAEINELRTILKRSCKNSLVIGDEIASGTEHISAISLVASGINHLSNKGSSFIFATHIHELCNLECVRKLSNVRIKHLSVYFDKDKNCLVFDRILKDGNGDTLYGLEISKSLDLPTEFLIFAEDIRKIYTGDSKTIVNTTVSKYNKDVFVDKCQICNSNTDEIHHITEQQYADSKGILQDRQIHKNVKHNLINVCSVCHDKIHSSSINIEGYKKTTNGIVLEFNINDSICDENKLVLQVKELRKEGLSYNKIKDLISEELKINITLYKIKKILK